MILTRCGKGIAKTRDCTFKKSLSQLEKEILKGNKIALFVDDFEVLKPKLAVLLMLGTVGILFLLQE